MDIVELSRFQFAITALYHFIFVPLTLGLCWILVIMEALYLITGKVIYRDMTQFWGKLFGINFALGVTTGITMEFQFGTNWSYYSHYVGDIFGAPLALEGLMAFFLESTLVGLFFFGWQKMSRRQHFIATLFMALGTNLSALWILVANGWMQSPVGAAFNFETMRMELTSFAAVFFNLDAQHKFVHTVSAGYVTGAMFVLSISSWYLLKKKDREFAQKSFSIAAAFGLMAILAVIILGDESGYRLGKSQPSKLAALEAMWETEPAPASFNVVVKPNEAAMKNDFAVKIPFMMGIIGTRSLDKQLAGIHDIVAENAKRIESGRHAVLALEKLRQDKNDSEARKIFAAHQENLGFGLLLKQYSDDLNNVSPETIAQAARSTIPRVAPMFWSFRIMVGCGFLMLMLFAYSLWSTLKNTFAENKWLLRVAVFSLPLPWIAVEMGWLLTEYGRQPWTIYEVLPTHLSASSLSTASLYGSLAGFIGFYTILLMVEVYLMRKYVHLGPSSLGTGRYDNENMQQGA